MSSKSIPSRWLVVFATLVLWVGVAHAGKKKIVVLDFDGPKAEKFHDEVVKLVGKKHTVVATEKWNGAAEELGATKTNSKNIKKIAKKLKVDGVIWGKIDKRDGTYIIKLKLRSGATGEVLGDSVQTQSEKSSLDDTAERDIKDELIARIASLESNTGGGDEDVAATEPVEDKPKKGFGRDKDEDKPKNEDKPKKEKDPPPVVEEDRPKKKKKKKEETEVAIEDGNPAEGMPDDGGGDDQPPDPALDLSPGRRAIDAVLGLSFTARNLKFSYNSDLASVPPGYKQSVPVGGALVDITAYPLAFGHKKTDITTNIGIGIIYDQALVISSRKKYLDDMGTQQTATLSTSEKRWQVAAKFRYPIGKGAKAPVVGASLGYGKQSFTVDDQLPNGEDTDIPSVTYTMITPAAFVKFPVTDKIILNLDAGFHAITNTGAIQSRTQYGAATVSGYSIVLGADYMVTQKIFARAGVRYQSIGLSFKGDPMSKTNTRDGDPEQDVTGAKDTYFGGSVTAGYVF